MKHLRTFEKFDINLKKVVDINRSIMKNKSVTKLLKGITLLDDLIHLEFKNIGNLLHNKSGYKKIYDLSSELGVMKMILNNSKDEEVTYQDMIKYGVDENVILYLNDEDVKEYLKYDKRETKILDEEMKSIIDYFKGFADWKKKQTRK